MSPVAADVISEQSVRAVVDKTVELGRLLVERQSTISFTYKADGTVLSELDQELQGELHQTIRALPDEAAANAHFVGEEEDSHNDSSQSLVKGRLNWIVDALDGTAVYTKGLNAYGLSIALLDEAQKPVFALIHLPALFGRIYLASAHDGTFTRYEYHPEALQALPRRIGLPPSWANGAPPVTRSYLYANSDLHRIGLESFRGKVRNLGGTAAHLALLSDGTEDPTAVLLSRCNSWDIAAGLALCTAGGYEIRVGKSWQPLDYTAAFRHFAEQRSAAALVVGHPKILRELEGSLRGLTV